MEKPNPALVTQREAQRLPRLGLLALCTVYLLPGLFGRDPWKSADVMAFGYMQSIAEGRSSWLAPTVGGLPPESALLPYWLGAAAIKLFGGLVGAPVAARLVFALVLALVFVLTWYSTYLLARTEAAQPLPLAFGGEAHGIDYARAIADGGLLALMACLGLLQLGHETTPELVQLGGATLFLFGLSLSPFRPVPAGLAVLAALPILAASGAPSVALALGLVGLVASRVSDSAPARRLVAWLVAGIVLATVVGSLMDAWAWRARGIHSSEQWMSLLRQLLWFPWPAWPLTLWTLWQWRRQLQRRHISAPLGCALVAIGACVVMGSSDRALMLALPPLAALAAFALPTLQRGTAAAIDWFSVFFFSGAAIALWVIYVSLQTGVPARPAANVVKLAPGFELGFSPFPFGVAVAGTLAWFALVRWRTGRSRHALWKSLVLPASGVALCWLLVMTLMLPLADYARSYRVQIERIARHVPRGACVLTQDLPRAQLAALEHFGRFRPHAEGAPDGMRCDYLLVLETRQRPRRDKPGWDYLATARRPTDREEATAIYRRSGPER